MLYMVIVPIIPDYLRVIGAWETHQIKLEQKPDYEKVVHKIYHNASGDYGVAMMFGLVVMFFSTLIFACGNSYSV